MVHSVGDIARQWCANRFKCIPRNTNMLINTQGYYTFCFNDIRHSRQISHVADMALAEALARREASVADPAICDHCNLRGRYRPMELLRVAAGYAKARLAAA